jgi:arylsulfatase
MGCAEREQRQISARAMEVYAAMVERMDWNIGRVVDYLRQQGHWITPSSCSCPITVPRARCWKRSQVRPGTADLPQSALRQQPRQHRPRQLLRLVRAELGAVATAPSRLFKAFTTEGGIRVPALLHYPQLPIKGRSATALAR